MATANAVELESLVMPGDVVASHADIETDCSACHTAFARHEQSGLCVDCHKEIGADQSGGKGFHGLNPEARGSDCADCHAEHIGRKASIVVFKPADFGHAHADFLLKGKHKQVDCDDCHTAGSLYRDAQHECIACHRDDDEHQGGLGEQCATCHVARGWEIVEFSHELETGYALLGAHADTPCSACHIEHAYENTDSECIACHRADDVHKGRRGDDCASCHGESNWEESFFDHTRMTEFPLRGGHAEVACDACHADSVHGQKPGTTCFACHGEDDPHAGQLGKECASCHNERDWLAEVRFDHEFTAFPLFGAHAVTECGDCHDSPRFEDAATACSSCHSSDDVHKGGLGENCGSCHNPYDWSRWRFDHLVQTRFALDGAHSELACADCHQKPPRQGGSTPSRCVDCHRRDDVHDRQFGSDCGRCHSTETFSGGLLP